MGLVGRKMAFFHSGKTCHRSEHTQHMAWKGVKGIEGPPTNEVPYMFVYICVCVSVIYE